MSQEPSPDTALLAQKIDKLEVIARVTQSLMAETDLKALLARIHDGVKEVAEADRATIYLIDRDTNEMWSYVAHGMEQESIRFPLGRGIAGQVGASGEIINIPDAYQDPRFNPEFDTRTGYRTSSILTLPMRNHKGEIIGAVQALNRKDGPFTAGDEELLLSLASSAAVAVDNTQLIDEIQRTFDSAVVTFAQLIDARDYITGGHTQRVTKYALELAGELEWGEVDRAVLRCAALLHDIGKIGVSELILTKPGRLTDEEFAEMKRHAALTKEILSKFYWGRALRDVPAIASSHHERLNGTGYPDGLRDGQIPPGGKVLAIVDVYDALTTARQYKGAMPEEKVLSILMEESGTSFEPGMVDAFVRLRRRLRESQGGPRLPGA